MQFTALILAGGRSQRMGQDKALLKKNGVPLLRRTWEVAETITPNICIVTPWRDRYQVLLPPQTEWIDEPLLPPGAPPAGPLVAFAHALSVVKADWILLLACDLPNLRAEVLQQWRQALEALPTEAIAYLPHTAAGWEPLCGFYRSTCRLSLQTYLSSGRRSFQGWLTQESVTPIPYVPLSVLANCNTPTDRESLGIDLS